MNRSKKNGRTIGAMALIASMIPVVLTAQARETGVDKTTWLYAVKGTDSLYMDRYVAEASRETNAPCLIFAFGGGFVGGERDNPVARKFWGLVPVQEACSMIFFTQGNAYRSMIHGFKYRGQWRTALRLGRWFGTELRESGLYGDVDVVVPVPLHYRRLLSRGYNQAEYFGRGIAKALGVPLDARSVVRSGYNRSQARTADRSERWDNVKGIFSVRRPASLAGRHLLLVDDVLTSGQSMADYKEEIERCGGKVVAAIFYGKTVTRPPLLLIKAHVWGGCIVNKIKELTK